MTSILNRRIDLHSHLCPKRHNPIFQVSPPRNSVDVGRCGIQIRFHRIAAFCRHRHKQGFSRRRRSRPCRGSQRPCVFAFPTTHVSTLEAKNMGFPANLFDRTISEAARRYGRCWSLLQRNHPYSSHYTEIFLFIVAVVVVVVVVDGACYPLCGPTSTFQTGANFEKAIKNVEDWRASPHLTPYAESCAKGYTDCVVWDVLGSVLSRSWEFPVDCR